MAPLPPLEARVAQPLTRRLQKKGTNMSGTEMQRAKEAAAEIMRKKQAAGTFFHLDKPNPGPGA